MLPPARFATCRCQFLVQIVDIRRGSSPMTGPLHYSKTKARGHSTRDLVSSRDSGDRTWQDSSRFMSIFAGGLSSGRGRKSFKPQQRSEEHTSELQSRMRNSYAVFRLKKKNNPKKSDTSEYTEGTSEYKK